MKKIQLKNEYMFVHENVYDEIENEINEVFCLAALLGYKIKICEEISVHYTIIDGIMYRNKSKLKITCRIRSNSQLFVIEFTINKDRILEDIEVSSNLKNGDYITGGNFFEKFKKLKLML